MISIKCVNRYFTVNGRSFPDTIQDNGYGLLPNQPYGSLVRIQPYDATRNPKSVLIRMINVGAVNHPFHPHGDHLTANRPGRPPAAQPHRWFSGLRALWRDDRFGSNPGLPLQMGRPGLLGSQYQPFPVAQPNYRNLTFKDGVPGTAATPTLGTKARCPPGPLHSTFAVSGTSPATAMP